MTGEVFHERTRRARDRHRAFQVSDNDVILVCTSGLTDTVDEASIADELRSDCSPDEISARLVGLASGRDDVTALVARYHLPD